MDKYKQKLIHALSDINTDGEVVRWIERNFPELRESEDETIRREIIDYLQLVGKGDSDYAQPMIDRWITYLEKQKENPKSADSIPSDCASDAKCGNSQHKVEDSPEGRKLADEVVAYLIKSGYQPIIKDTLDQKHFQIKIPRHKEDFFHSKEYKHCREILDEYYYEGDFAGDVYTLYVLRQKEQKTPMSNDLDEEIEKFFDECIEAHDAKIYGVDKRVITVDCYELTARHFAKWGEKQKEPHYTKRNALFDKCVENCDPEVMKEVSDKVDEMLRKEQKPIQTSEEKEYIRTLKNLISGFIRDKQPEDVAYYRRVYDWLDGRHIEQKPAEWSEEEFETFRKTLAKDAFLDEITSTRVAKKLLNSVKSFSPQPKEEWTINNAKPGDILHTSSTASSKTFIFKGIRDDEHGTVECFCCYDSEDGFLKGEEGFIGWKTDKYKLATPEQCIELGRIMGKAGYIFYFENNQLRKLNEPHWKPSEEQMSMLLAVINDPNNAGSACHLALISIYEQLKKL